MKNILCYGDSNTYGYSPVTGGRYPKEIRWTGVMAGLLGDGYNVIEEGCNGRTTIYEDPTEPWKNGRDYLKPCLNTHKPVDVVILMLGTNDLKDYFNLSAEQIAFGAEELIKDTIDFTTGKQGFVPKIILVAPPVIGDNMANSVFGNSFDQTAIERSKKFGELYGAVAARNNCVFVDGAKYVKSSEMDSLHLMPEEHEKLAGILAETVKNL